MNQQRYNRYFNQYQQLTHQWEILLKEMVSQLGKIIFENPPHLPVNSSNGDWYGITVTHLSMTEDGYLMLTDGDGDVYYKKALGGDASLILISEILEQTNYQFENEITE